jgi:signal transduction histidine kinase
MQADHATPSDEEIRADVEAVGELRVVPKILALARQLTGLRFTAVARVTDHRWIACAVDDDLDFGLGPGSELEIGTTLCNEVRQGDAPIVIDHVAESEIYRDHATPAMYGFQSYFSIPLRRPGGEFFGTLCGIDPEPGIVDTDQTRSTLQMFADLIGFHLDAGERLDAVREELTASQRLAQARDLFIAILGHDLRSPLATLGYCVAALEQRGNPELQPTVSRMHRSVIRMDGLIAETMDFARGWLGSGIPVRPVVVEDLPEVLLAVVDELRGAWPDREIVSDVQLDGPVECDAARLGQVLSNLLGNALLHGDDGAPVQFVARTTPESLSLTVINEGDPIPEDVRRELFRPFKVRDDQSRNDGLGLGLYISHEIIHAHDGALTASSEGGQTRLVATLPRRSRAGRC